MCVSCVFVDAYCGQSILDSRLQNTSPAWLIRTQRNPPPVHTHTHTHTVQLDPIVTEWPNRVTTQYTVSPGCSGQMSAALCWVTDCKVSGSIYHQNKHAHDTRGGAKSPYLTSFC